MATTSPETIATIDGQYIHPGRAAAYLVVDGQEAAFVDTITRFSTPYLLEGLEAQALAPEQVRYLIVTHVHLDHSGGTAELLKHCPNAQVICHPRAERHIVDPAKLVKGATQIYGEDVFRERYGEIEPVEAERVTAMEDDTTLDLGGRTLKIFHSRGHAKHHLAVFDPVTNSVFAGDAFGICFNELQGGKRPYIQYVCAPPDFDPPKAAETVQRIMDTGCERVYVTHFGETRAVQNGGKQLIENINSFAEIGDKASETGLVGAELENYCREHAEELIKREIRDIGLDFDDEKIRFWSTAELMITSKGLAHYAQTKREA